MRVNIYRIHPFLLLLLRRLLLCRCRSIYSFQINSIYSSDAWKRWHTQSKSKINMNWLMWNSSSQLRVVFPSNQKKNNHFVIRHYHTLQTHVFRFHFESLIAQLSPSLCVSLFFRSQADCALNVDESSASVRASKKTEMNRATREPNNDDNWTPQCIRTDWTWNLWAQCSQINKKMPSNAERERERESAEKMTLKSIRLSSTPFVLHQFFGIAA